MTLRDADPTAQAPPADVAFERTADQLATAMRAWEEHGEAWADEVFDDFASRAFPLQYDGIEAYRRYCERRGVAPATVSGWMDIPPVPVAAFRHVPLIVGGEGATKLEFLTSGTTGGPGSRGRHLIRDPDLYRSSMEAAFRRLVLDRPAPDGPVLDRPALSRADPGPDLYASLVAPFSETPESSLAWMIGGLVERLGAPGSRHFASDSGVDWEAAADFVAGAAADGRPVCILTTTLALDAWIRYLNDHDRGWALPAGSLVMDTGGAKGREGLSRADVCRSAAERLGLDPSRIVNEFGMTELLSQLYSVPEGSGPGGDTSPDAPWLRGPPWLKVRALDPNDLSPLPDGEPGLLSYFDLANLGSVCAVLTEDVGRVSAGAVQWLHRSPGAPPRGCSLATAELLAARKDVVGD